MCRGCTLRHSPGAPSELHDKLTTNPERLEEISKILNDTSLEPADRFRAIDDIVATADEYRYVIETDLSIETMLRAVQAAARSLLDFSTSLDPPNRTLLSDLWVWRNNAV
jgi:hypothetical protein